MCYFIKRRIYYEKLEKITETGRSRLYDDSCMCRSCRLRRWSYGIAEKEGLDLAVEEINKEGKVKMDVEMVDTKGNVQQAVAAAQKMIAAKKVLVVGPLISGEYKAIGPLFQQAKIPLLGSATTAEGLIEIGDYMFRNCVPESQNIPQTVKKTHKLLGYKKVPRFIT